MTPNRCALGCVPRVPADRLDMLARRRLHDIHARVFPAPDNRHEPGDQNDDEYPAGYGLDGRRELADRRLQILRTFRLLRETENEAVLANLIAFELVRVLASVGGSELLCPPSQCDNLLAQLDVLQHDRSERRLVVYRVETVRRHLRAVLAIAERFSAGVMGVVVEEVRVGKEVAVREEVVMLCLGGRIPIMPLVVLVVPAGAAEHVSEGRLVLAVVGNTG